eukprot:COSAG04_NODE_3634_length_2656_cov_1.231521_3_plen_80_part_00
MVHEALHQGAENFGGSPAFMCFGRSTVVVALPVFIVRHKAWRAFQALRPLRQRGIDRVDGAGGVAAAPQAGGEKIRSYW